jgi:hypothetical protein
MTKLALGADVLAGAAAVGLLLGVASTGCTSPTAPPVAGQPGETPDAAPSADAGADGPAPSDAAGLPEGDGPGSSDTGGSGSSIKWHPGHYVWLDYHASQAEHFALMDTLTADSTITGFQLYVRWSAIEGSTKADYSPGFALIDAYLAKLKTLQTPKRLIVGLVERAFGCFPGEPCSYASTPYCDPSSAQFDDPMCKTAYEAHCASSAGMFPSYLVTDPNYNGAYVCSPYQTRWSGSLVSAARIWDAPNANGESVMGRLSAVSEALAAGAGGHAGYDQDPSFEMYEMGETALGVSGNGFSSQNEAAQLKAWFDVSKAAWKHTQVRLVANYLGGDGPVGKGGTMADMLSHATAGGGVIVGGPDVVPMEESQAFRIFRGGTTDLPDQRGVVPWIAEVQGDFTIHGSWSPAQMYDTAYNVEHMSYMIWLYNTWDGSPAQQWSAAILPLIHSVHGQVHAECPTAYGYRCVSN